MDNIIMQDAIREFAVAEAEYQAADEAASRAYEAKRKATRQLEAASRRLSILNADIMAEKSTANESTEEAS